MRIVVSLNDDSLFVYPRADFFQVLSDRVIIHTHGSCIVYLSEDIFKVTINEY